MSPKFYSFFVSFYSVYGSIFSSTDYDFMAGAESVCSFDAGSNYRIAKLLGEMSHYARGFQSSRHIGYKTWAMRRYHSLAYRLFAITGMHAYKAILDTCGLPVIAFI